jgi:TonB-dependent SusC/RagA subfamily outer membrane receptor
MRQWKVVPRKMRFCGWQHGVRILLTIIGGLLAFGVNARAQGSHTVTLGIQGDNENSPRKSQPSPNTHQRQASQINLTVQDSAIRYIIRAIGRQLDRPVSFNNADPRFSKRISVRIAGQEVMDAFATVLKGTGLVAVLAQDGRTIVVRPHERETQADTVAERSGKVSGTVIDSANQKTVEGATVSIQGSDIRVVTSKNGRFLLSGVPLGRQVLQIKTFGYQVFTRVLEISDGDQVKVTGILTPVSTILDGVVTSVVGVQRKMEIGSDIATLNVDSIMQVAPITSVTDLLTARIPGVVVMPSSGVPGAPARIRFRGTNSIERENDPIVIVDGVRVDATPPSLDESGASTAAARWAGEPSPLDQIDPNSIETIEVFRGPSAAAIYGSDAGNGVIVITTKRGQPGRFRWNAKLDGGFTSIPQKFPENFFAYGKGFSGNYISGRCDGDCLEIDSVIHFQPLNDPDLTVLGRGENQGATFTVSGGERSITYSLTGSVSRELGVFKLPSLEEGRFRQEHGFAAPKWMRRPLWYNTWGGNGQVSLPLGQSGGVVAITSALFFSEQQQTSLNSSLLRFQSDKIQLNFLGTAPLLDEFYQRRSTEGLTFRSGATLRGWQVRSWLPIEATVGLSTRSSETRTVLPQGYMSGADSTGFYRLNRVGTQDGTFSIGSTLLRSGRGRIPGIRVPIGIQLQKRQNSALSGAQVGIPEGVTDPTFGSNTGSSVLSESRGNTATYGWFAAPTIDLNSRFFVNPGFRLDGGSASGGRAGLSLLPKVNVSWIAIDPSSRPLFGVLTFLRPRFALGIAGVQPGAGDHLRLFASQMAALPGESAIEVARLQSIGNTRLRPERSREFEGGVDADLWQQRVALKFSTYHKLRIDAIVSSPIAPSLGGGIGNTNFKQNIGNVRNTGVEASIDAQVLDRRMIEWRVGATVSKNSNVLLNLAPGVRDGCAGQGARCGGGQRIVPGYPLFGFWQHPIVGYYDRNGEIVYGDSLEYVGAAEPAFQATLSTSIAVLNGRLRLNTDFSYQNGMTQAASNTSAGSMSYLKYYNPSLSLEETALLNLNIQKIDVLRWQSFSVNYQIPSEFLRWLPGSSMAISFQGSNLGVRTNYRYGIDPNVNSAGSSGNVVNDNGALPQPRLYQIAVQIGR